MTTLRYRLRGVITRRMGGEAKTIEIMGIKYNTSPRGNLAFLFFSPFCDRVYRYVTARVARMLSATCAYIKISNEYAHIRRYNNISSITNISDPYRATTSVTEKKYVVKHYYRVCDDYLRREKFQRRNVVTILLQVLTCFWIPIVKLGYRV